MFNGFPLYSLAYIATEITEPKQPSFEIRMELKEMRIKFIPDVKIEEEGNFLKYIDNMLSYVENIIYSMPHIVRLESTFHVS